MLPSFCIHIGLRLDVFNMNCQDSTDTKPWEGPWVEATSILELLSALAGAEAQLALRINTEDDYDVWCHSYLRIKRCTIVRLLPSLDIPDKHSCW